MNRTQEELVKTEGQANSAAEGPAIGPEHTKYLQFPTAGEDSGLLRSLATAPGEILKFQHPDWVAVQANQSLIIK